jgi:hypothetical protein
MPANFILQFSNPEGAAEKNLRGDEKRWPAAVAHKKEHICVPALSNFPSRYSQQSAQMHLIILSAPPTN